MHVLRANNYSCVKLSKTRFNTQILIVGWFLILVRFNFWKVFWIIMCGIFIIGCKIPDDLWIQVTLSLFCVGTRVPMYKMQGNGERRFPLSGKHIFLKFSFKKLHGGRVF